MSTNDLTYSEQEKLNKIMEIKEFLLEDLDDLRDVDGKPWNYDIGIARKFKNNGQRGINS